MEINPEIIQSLYDLFGWPGLFAGIAVVSLAVLSKTLFVDYWEGWPRWVRFGLGFLVPAATAGVSSLVTTGGVFAIAIVTAVTAGLAGIGVHQALKTAKAPKALPRPFVRRPTT